MKNKNYRLLTLLLALPLIAGCELGYVSSAEPGPESEPVSSAQVLAVTGVSIAEPSELTVLDGSRITLKASVAGDEGVSQKVTWSTSDDTIATVTNGVVNFLKVSEQKKVTITATSVADVNFSDSVEFTVEHCPFDLKTSRGNADTSLFLDEGSFIIEDPVDVALIFADVYSTRWYVEATIQIDGFDMTDQWPKFGIMASERDDGMWCYEQSHQFFYYLDSPSAQTTWSGMNVVTEDNDLVNWDWGKQIGSATASPVAKMGEPFKMGLMRDGNKYYQFYGKATDITPKLVGTFEYESFDGKANYVWVGGWKTNGVVSDPKYMVGDEIDTMYSLPEGLALAKNEETLYYGDTVQIEVSADGLWDRNKLKFRSSDEEIATVDGKGLVTAGTTKVGDATITAYLEGTELSAEFVVTVTDDRAFKVEIDGEMNDLIWSETVKKNSYLLKRAEDYYIRIYAAKNSRGLYLFMDYTAKEPKTIGGGWWQWDNCEFRVADDEKVWSEQYWLSAEDGGSFCSTKTQTRLPVYYKALTLGEDGLYHGAFEMFIQYGIDKVEKDQATYMCFGYNPSAGWVEGYKWYAAIDDSVLQVTADGFKHHGSSCSEEGGHVYGNWIRDLEPTCIAEGSQHKDCIICGHRVTEALEIVADAHHFDYEHAVVSKVPNCVETGIGTATCTLCGATEETILPCDYTNHVDEDYPSSHKHCEACHIGSFLNNDEGDYIAHNFGGWTNPNAGWFDTGVHSGDFTLTFEFNMRACIADNGVDIVTGNPGGSCWRTVLPVAYDGEGYVEADRHCKVWRMDWFGWTDGGFAIEENNGSIPANFDWAFNWEGYSNMDITLVVKKVGAAVTLDWVWLVKAEGRFQGMSFEYHQGCTLNDAYVGKIGFALTAEWTNFTVTRCELTRG